MLEELAGARRPRRSAARRARARRSRQRRATGSRSSTCSGTGRSATSTSLVDARALIPRPETELLVERRARAAGVASATARSCATSGAGRGAIALSLAVESQRRGPPRRGPRDRPVDDGALELADGERSSVSGPTRSRFHRGSWYEALPAALRGRVDVCCSNPPYVSVAERPGLARELDFEPELALVAADGADGTPGFAAIEAVVAGAREWLAPGGTLLVEHADAHRDAARSLAATLRPRRRRRPRRPRGPAPRSSRRRGAA